MIRLTVLPRLGPFSGWRVCVPTTHPSSAVTNAAPLACSSWATTPRRVSTAPPLVAMSIGAVPCSCGVPGFEQGEQEPMNTACAGLIALNGPAYTPGASALTRMPGCGKYCSANIGRQLVPYVWYPICCSWLIPTPGPTSCAHAACGPAHSTSATAAVGPLTASVQF